MQDNRLLTVKETAKMLGISPQTIYNGIHRKTETPFPIPPKRIGRAVRFPLSKVLEYMEE